VKIFEHCRTLELKGGMPSEARPPFGPLALASGVVVAIALLPHDNHSDLLGYAKDIPYFILLGCASPASSQALGLRRQAHPVPEVTRNIKAGVN
jgi:hypothetical protein